MNVGFSPEQPYFYDYLTAKELLEYYAQLSGVPTRERSKRAADSLARVGLKDIDRLQLRKFSKGMLQRVALAQAIVHDPKFLFLDEPMSGLDPIGRREVRDLIQELKEHGKTIFFSTHILSDAEALCDRVAVLNHGELKGVGVVRELLSGSEGSIEVLWQGNAGRAELEALGAKTYAAGAMTRAVLPQSRLDAAIDALRKANARIQSVNPVRHTLEDFFIEKLNLPPQEKTMEVMRSMSVFPIAYNTYREAVRDRVLYNLIFFALADRGLGLAVWTNFARHRAHRAHQYGAHLDLDFRHRDRDLRRHQPGLERDRA